MTPCLLPTQAVIDLVEAGLIDVMEALREHLSGGQPATSIDTPAGELLLIGRQPVVLALTQEIGG